MVVRHREITETGEKNVNNISKLNGCILKEAEKENQINTKTNGHLPVQKNGQIKVFFSFAPY